MGLTFKLESMKNEWSGDVGFGEGALKRKCKESLDYLGFIRGIGCLRRKSKTNIKADLERQSRILLTEKIFLTEGHAATKRVYNNKKDMPNVSEDTVFALAWDVEGYAKLLEMNGILSDKIKDIVSKVDGPGNFAPQLSDLKKKLQEYVKGVYTKRREAASHLLLFMISDEFRNYKPYAIAVRVIKYNSITDAKFRELKTELMNQMHLLGMTTVGM